MLLRGADLASNSRRAVIFSALNLAVRMLGRCLATKTTGLRRADTGAGAVATIDFGGLPYAIYTEKNATLTFNNMFLTGAAYGSSYLNNTRNSPYGACSSRRPAS